MRLCGPCRVRAACKRAAMPAALGCQNGCAGAGTRAAAQGRARSRGIRRSRIEDCFLPSQRQALALRALADVRAAGQETRVPQTPEDYSLVRCGLALWQNRTETRASAGAPVPGGGRAKAPPRVCILRRIRTGSGTGAGTCFLARAVRAWAAKLGRRTNKGRPVQAQPNQPGSQAPRIWPSALAGARQRKIGVPIRRRPPRGCRGTAGGRTPGPRAREVHGLSRAPAGWRDTRCSARAAARPGAVLLTGAGSASELDRTQGRQGMHRGCWTGAGTAQNTQNRRTAQNPRRIGRKEAKSSRQRKANFISARRQVLAYSTARRQT